MVYTIYRKQQIPASLDEAWDFFSSPGNLTRITPPDMGFRIQNSNKLEKMYPGQIIHYKVRPLWNIPVKWTTEITHVQQPFFFVDNQLAGPYRLWHHQHHFKEIPGGVEMTDILNYALPGGFLGRLMHQPLVRKRLEKIFNYRVEAVNKLFGPVKNSTNPETK